MNAATGTDRDVFLENLAAELTYAAYPIVLRHGVGEKWLDLELDLWRAVTETLKRLERAEVDCAAHPNARPKTSDFFG